MTEEENREKTVPVADVSASNEDSFDQSPEQRETRGMFDSVADFFKVMTLGIFKFAFYKLPLFIWEQISKIDVLSIFRYLRGIGRALFWCLVWLSIVFAAWIAFGLKQFLRFWTWIGGRLANMGGAFLHFFIENAGPIWFVIAIFGSIYGLLYITLKRRARRRNIPFTGVFAFLKRRRNKTNGFAPERDGNGPGNERSE